MSPPKTDYEFPPPPLLSSALTATTLAASMPEMYVVPGVVVIERFFTVPLDYLDETKGTIQIFARHCVSLARQKQMEQLPFMVYLQGGTDPVCFFSFFPILGTRELMACGCVGPGMEASSQPPSNSGMLKVLMDKGYQVLQLDQRGTGLSTPISGATLQLLGGLENQIRYLKLFRADNIGTTQRDLRGLTGSERL